MKKFRLSFVFLMAALVLALVPAVLAQDTLGASQEDFDLWTTANANMGALKTATYGFTANVTVAGMGDSNVTIDLTGSGVLDGSDTQPAFQLDVTGTAVQGGQTTPVNFALRIVNDMLYINNNNEGWKGGPLDQMASSFAQGFTGMPTTPTGSDLSSLASSPVVGQLMTALEGLQPSDFLALSRTDANGLADLTLTLDVPKLITSPAVAPLFTALMSMGNTSAPATDAAQITQMQTMFASVLGTSKITFSEMIDPASKLVQQMAFNANVPLDGMIGPGALVSCDFELNLSNHDQPVSVEAPADAVMMESSAGG